MSKYYVDIAGEAIDEAKEVAGVLVLETAEELAQFKYMVSRAVNTWSNVPNWLRDLHDKIQNNPTAHS